MLATRLSRIQLRRHSTTQVKETPKPETIRPRRHLRDLIIGWGGQGKRVLLRILFILREMAIDSVGVVAIDGDAYDWPTLSLPGYDPLCFNTDNSITLGETKSRDMLRADPFLRARYDRGGLWRGVPVSETFQRGGQGGRSYPTYAAAYYESERERALAALHQWSAPLIAEPDPIVGSDLLVLYQQRQQAQARPHQKPHRVLIIGSGVGSWGWIGHVLGSYDTRLVLNSLGIANYELYGIVLGPNIYNGLTPNIKPNWHALMDQLRYLSRHGMHRKYGGHGAEVDIDAPPYDPARLLLVDQARGPHNGRRATEEELDAFQWNVAASIALLLASDAGDQLVSQSANPVADDAARPERQGEELFGTLGSALAGADVTGIRRYLEQASRLHLIEALREQI